MKRFLILLAPVLVFMLAFRPVTGITISGKVTDDKGSPVAYASVVLKGTKEGTMTGTDGTYKLTLSRSSGTLVFSALGFAAQEKPVKATGNNDAVLVPETLTMSEVVVTGYATQKRRDMTGSVAQVHSAPVGSNGFAKQLAGRVPGVQVTGNNGYLYYDQQPGFFDGESYDVINENKFSTAIEQPLSTFSIDVDAAGYSNMRRFLNNGQLPPANAVRIEEMVNYFKYEYPQPSGNDPFSINTEISDAPWNKDHKLVLIGLQGKKIPIENLPASNLVFLIDVSGSMQGPERLGLVKASMKMLVEQLREQDKVAIVVYAGRAANFAMVVVLPTPVGPIKANMPP